MSQGERYQIRALDRALTILRVLNQHNGLNASELSRLVDLPRPTVLRLLLTLGEAGYLVRCEADTSFRASGKVRELSIGYRAQDGMAAIAQAFLAELANELAWPLAVTRLDGDSLMVEALNDHNSQTLQRRDSAGRDLPMLGSASGYLMLAAANPVDCERMLSGALRTEADLLAGAGMDAAAVMYLIDEARREHHAILHMPSHSSVSVPILIDGQVFAALNLRMHASLSARQERIRSFVPALTKAAEELGHRIAVARA